MQYSMTLYKLGLKTSTGLLCLATSFPTLAQKPQTSTATSWKQVTLNVKGTSLANLCKVLSAQIGHGIIVDGVPLREQADVEFSGDGSKALDKVADVFDYSWTLGKSGVVLMRKRFTNPDEMPQFTRAEWRRVSRNVLSILSAFSFDHNAAHEQEYPVQLYHTFTPEQVQSLQSGKKLYFNQMPEAQQHLVQAWIYTGYFAPEYAAWQNLFDRLDVMHAGYIKQLESISKEPGKSGRQIKITRIDYYYRDVNGNDALELLGYKQNALEKQP